MLQKLQILVILLNWVILGCCNAATASLETKNNSIFITNIKLKDLLSISKLKDLAGIAAQYQVTSGSGSIHFMKINFYNDSPNNPCNMVVPTVSPDATASIVDNGDGFVFNSGDYINLNATSAYSLVSNQLGIAAANDIKCIQLYVNGGNESNDGINCNAFAQDCSSNNRCDTSTLTQVVSWGANPEVCVTPATIPTNASAPFLYVANYVGNNITQCAFSAENLTGCNNLTSSSFDNTFYIGANNGYSIITNVGSQSAAGDGSYTICKINPENGTFENDSLTDTCSKYTTLPGDTPFIITSLGGCYPNDNYVYFTEAGYAGGAQLGNPAVYFCQFLATSGSGNPLSNCTEVAGYSFNAPIDISIYKPTNSSVTYAYIMDTANLNDIPPKLNNIVICNVNLASGELSSCTGYSKDPSNFQNIGGGIAINNGYVYFANAGPDEPNSYVYACPIDQNTGQLTLNSCVSYRGDGSNQFNTPTDIIIHNDYAYITNQTTSTITYCQVSGTTLTNCSNTDLGGLLSGPGGLKIY